MNGYRFLNGKRLKIVMRFAAAAKDHEAVHKSIPKYCETVWANRWWTLAVLKARNQQPTLYEPASKRES